MADDPDPKVREVRFETPEELRDTLTAILEAALEKIEKGEVLDCAVVLATHDRTGPGFFFQYHGDGSFARLVCGVEALRFDLMSQWSEKR